MRSSHAAGMKPIANGTKTASNAPVINLRSPFSHKNASIAKTAKSAPLECDPKAEKPDRSIAASKLHRSQWLFACKCKYLNNGIVITVARANALFSSIKEPGGPQTRNWPPDDSVNKPPLTE